jgi:hypothetical protein
MLHARSLEFGPRASCPIDATVTRRLAASKARKARHGISHNLKSDLRTSNHQAMIVQLDPRLYDCLMVTQITLKTERFHGFPSDRLPAEVDPPDGEVLLHLNRLRLRSTLIT